MEEPIRKEDIIDLSGTQDSINDLIKALENLSLVMRKDLKESADALQKSLQGINVATKEGQELVKAASVQAEGLAAQQKEQNRLDKERVQLQARLTSLDSEQAASNAQLRVQIERKNRSLKEEKQLYDSAQGSVNRMRKDLKDLTAEYNRLAPAARDKVAPAIKKVTEELKKAESAIGNNTRNVGNYKSAIMGAAKQLFAFISPIALATVALNGLKNAFAGMEQGTKFLSGAKEQFKSFFQNIVSGNFKYAFGNQLPKDMKALSEEWDRIRKGDRGDLKVIATLETEVAILRYKSADATETEANQLMYLNRALEKEDELIKYKIADKQEELDWVVKALKTREEDTDLLNRQAQLEAEIMNIQGDRNLRLMTRSSTLKKKISDKEIKDAKDDNEAYGNWLIAHEEWLAEEEIRIKTEREKANEHYWEIIGKGAEDAAEREWALIEETEKKRAEAEQTSLEQRQNIITESFNFIANSIGQLNDLYQTQKDNELSAAGDNATKREEIERKYARKMQVLSIGQALINGALAITEIQKKYAAIPAVAAIFTALTVASTLAQVAIIRAQKFAKGGSGILNGPAHASGGINVGIGEAEGGEHIAITSRKMTSRYGPKMLDAVSNSINQGKFFEVWANVNREMGVSDPYTKKMYELMTKTPTVYTDTNGDTVKEYPNGQKYVIKKLWKN